MFLFSCLIATKNTKIDLNLSQKVTKERCKMIKKESVNKTSGEEMFALFALIVLVGCILLV